MKSQIRSKLNKYPSMKLFLKSILDVLKGNFFQARNALIASIQTLNCQIKRIIKNRNIVECNYCGWKGNEFFPHHTKSDNKSNEVCPNCFSIPRYRLLLYFLNERMDFFNKYHKILEIGPNRSLQTLCLNNPNCEYISIDIRSPYAMIRMDAQNLKFDNEFFDVIFCISVLNFIEDDQKAISEIFRVLKPGGYAIVAAGIDKTMSDTVEYDGPDPIKNFARRIYGRDIIKNLASVGFSVKRYDIFPSIPQEVRDYYVMSNNVIYYSRKHV